MTATPTSSPNRSLSQTLARRTVISIAVVVVLCVPFVVFGLLSGQMANASWALMGGIIGLVNLMVGGRGIGYLTVGLLTVLTPVAIVSGSVPLAGAGLMAMMCFGVGLSARLGLHHGMLLIPIYLSFLIIAPPPWGSAPVDRGSTSYLLWNMLFLGGGALWAVIVFPPLLHNMAPAHPEPNLRADTIIYTTIITVLCAGSTLAVLIWRPGSDGAWLVITLLAVTEVGHSDTLNKTGARVVGTVAGVTAAAGIARLTTSEPVLLGIGLLLLVMTLVVKFGPHNWLFVALLTPTVVLLNSPNAAAVPETDKQRLLYTLLGVGLVLLASAIAVIWSRYGQPDPGEPAPSAT
jgi:hypothetical protein